MRTVAIPRALQLGALGLLALGAVFTALMGFAHTRPGRPLLVWLGKVTGKLGADACPLGYDVTQGPEQREAARRSFSAAHAGHATAQARPALGFTLDRTTRADALAWAASRGVRCRAAREADLSCTGVPAGLLPDGYQGSAVETLWLNFGGAGTLITVIAMRREREAGPLAATFAALQGALARDTGAPGAGDGDTSAAYLAGGALRQASREHRFRDYYALTRQTNMGDSFLLTEEYRSLTP